MDNSFVVSFFCIFSVQGLSFKFLVILILPWGNFSKGNFIRGGMVFFLNMPLPEEGFVLCLCETVGITTDNVN